MTNFEPCHLSAMSATMLLAGAVNFVGTASDMLTLLKYNTRRYEKSRLVN